MNEHKLEKGETWVPSDEQEREAIRLQLERILRHSLFAHSQRYPALLRYVVEQAIAGTVDHIKERTIGVLVFGRNPTYDANADPVVRVTAGQIRKRLSQYYSEPEHRGEIRILLPSGSYVPQVMQPALPEPDELQVEGNEQIGIPTRDANAQVEKGGSRTARSLLETMSWFVLATAVLLVLGAALLIVYWKLPPTDPRRDFWSSIADSSGPISLCIDTQPISELTSTSNDALRTGQGPSEVSVAQLGLLLRIASAARGTGGRFRIVRAGSTSFEVLRSAPLVLVGDADNLWAIRLTAQLKFAVVSDPDRIAIVDRSNKNGTEWSVPKGHDAPTPSRSYALIARFDDPILGQPAVILVGLGPGGTAAGVESVTNEHTLRAFLRRVPGGCSGKNLEMVVGASVIDGFGSAPSLLAANCW